jgi:hypothetical protein
MDYWNDFAELRSVTLVSFRGMYVSWHKLVKLERQYVIATI